jgi:uncharacterized protein (TIGR02246 family)
MNPAIHDQGVSIYTALLAAWNRRDAAAFAGLFTTTGHATGFDGSQMNGPAEIESELGAVFAHHPTSAYVAKVREVRALAPTVLLLRAIVGMVPPGKHSLKPDVNAIQSLVLVAEPPATAYRVALLQNTPAAFHGRPHLVAEMTEELTRVYEAGLLVAMEDRS